MTLIKDWPFSFTVIMNRSKFFDWLEANQKSIIALIGERAVCWDIVVIKYIIPESDQTGVEADYTLSFVFANEQDRTLIRMMV